VDLPGGAKKIFAEGAKSSKM